MTDSDYRDELHRVIRLVRTRYRLRVLLTGAVIFLVGAFVLLVFSAILLEQFKFGPSAVIAIRIGFYLALGTVLLRFLVLPLARRLSDTDIALYIETHEPSLQAALLSAVEYDTRTEGEAPGLIRRLLRQAVEKARAVEDGRRIEQKPLRWLPAAVTGSVALLVLVAMFGPPFFRNALRVLLTPWDSAEAAAPYAVLVEPGNTVVARGGDLRITARLRGFESDQVLLNVRVLDSGTTGQPDSRSAEGSWEITSMGESSDSSNYAAQLFDLEQPAEYFVESNGIRSPVFRLDVRDLPYTKSIDLEYRFPSYTGLAAQRIENGGDVAALRGTRVTVRVTPTMATAGGELVIEGKPPIALVPGDSGTLAAAFTIQGNGFYHIELLGMDSTKVRASLDYAIEALGDQPPLVQIVRPGRDTRVTSLEEVFIEARGEDDYGVQRLELVYSVNGGEEKIVELQNGAGRRKDVSAGHTLFLEEYELVPGDVVSYYARASDANPYGGPGTAATDIYFLQVRPFDREYREAEQAGMPGGQQGDSPEGLSEQQREIVSATYKANRDRATTPPAELRENLATIALAQGRLRQQVETLSRRMVQRGVSGSDSTFAAIAAELPKAIAAMLKAEERLGRREPGEALPPEQVALQHLQRAEAAYREIQVSRNSQAGGGGQPPRASSADDLADLFELENDRRQNQYETVQRGQEEQQRQELDEVMERLKQLASRQQQENERMLREAERMRQPGGASSGSSSQRRLAQEVDSLARRLERLQREQSTPELQQSLRRLQEAADAMRRSAAQPSQSGGQGTRALDRIEEARRLLEQGNANQIRQNLEQSAERARRLAQQQREVAQQAAALKPGDAPARRRLEQTKDRMAGEVQQLENDLERAARDARNDQREAARQVQQAVNDLREHRVREKIEYSKGLLGSPQASRQFEENITANLDELGRQLTEASEAVGEAPGERTARSLDRARALAQGLESLAERAREAQGQQNGQQGEQPGQQPSEQGSPGEQQGGEQRGGQANGQPRQGAPREGIQETSGDAQPGTPGGRMRGSDPRQLGRELRERRFDAEQLRRELLEEGVDVGELDQILRRLRAVEARGLGSDRQAVELLQSQVIEGLKEFEFALRRQLTGTEDRRPRSGRQGEVPAEYRELVDRYYESLSD